MAFRKGDRVEFEDKNQMFYGVVARGGKKKIRVVIDGGQREVSGHPSLFNYSDKEMPSDPPSAMDKWSVKKYKEIEGHGDTPTFSANICLNGKPVIFVSNNGWGGPNEYRPVDYNTEDVIDKFSTDIKSWCEQFGCESTSGMDDIWVDWYVYKRPYGVTAQDEIKHLNKFFASLSK